MVDFRLVRTGERENQRTTEAQRAQRMHRGEGKRFRRKRFATIGGEVGFVGLRDAVQRLGHIDLTEQ
jgi:hypothetical protein